MTSRGTCLEFQACMSGPPRTSAQIYRKLLYMLTFSSLRSYPQMKEVHFPKHKLFSRLFRFILTQRRLDLDCETSQTFVGQQKPHAISLVSMRSNLVLHILNRFTLTYSVLLSSQLVRVWVFYSMVIIFQGRKHKRRVVIADENNTGDS